MPTPSIHQPAATKKLFWEDPYMHTFQARLLAARPAALPDGAPLKNPPGAFQAALDQTAFYPEGGGQPADLGSLNGIPVLHVFEDQGVIWHVLAKDPRNSLEPDGQITGEINWNRRFDFMQQHLGQHLLSAVFDTLEARTIGFHLGEQSVTIDLDKGPFSTETLTAVESRANQIVFDDRPVLSTLVSEAAYRSMTLRKTPEISQQVRMVEVSDVDLCACSGTHPHTTGAVGLIKVIKSETYKGGCRITFLCGKRALDHFDALYREATRASGMLSVGWPELSASVSSLLQENKRLVKEHKELQQEWAALERERLLREAESVRGIPVVTVCSSSMDFKRLTFLANAFRSQPDLIALLGVTSPEPRFVLLNNTGVDGISMQQLLKDNIHLIEGKGGGNAASAQGGGSKPDGLAEMFLRIRESITKIIAASTA